MKDLTNPLDHVFSIIGFDVLIHGAIPFFSIIDLPSLRIEKDDTINELVNKMILEEQKDLVGKSSMLNKIAFELVIHICRYIYTKRELEPYLLKLKFLSDKRLINIIQYIQDNLENELANHKIAALAYVSKDYIGQFFKSLTNHNLQDYIESRRLERAHYLLRTTTDNIQEIAHKVGFKDPAYFSRRFKMRFNQNAKEIRKSEFLLM
ncbi:MAG: helix-turn-helix transcriptional regulator [Bacteroidetes bacterium]|nr:helix-turn-helix transcriptional regulator [Bacteroidota bacterium]